MNETERHYFILKDREIVAATVHEWVEWFENPGPTVAFTRVGTAQISTVFSGFEARAGRYYFETRVFTDGSDSGTFERCSTYDDAMKMHTRMVGEVQSPPPRRGDMRGDMRGE